MVGLSTLSAFLAMPAILRLLFVEILIRFFTIWWEDVKNRWCSGSGIKMPYPSILTILCKYCGKEIKVTRNDVLTIKDAKTIYDSCCIKCKIKRMFHLEKN